VAPEASLEREACNRMLHFLMIFYRSSAVARGRGEVPLQMVILGGLLNALYLMAVSVATIYLPYRQTDRRIKDGHLSPCTCWSPRS
jgi:hypothetical protein